jgi:MFS family permease
LAALNPCLNFCPDRPDIGKLYVGLGVLPQYRIEFFNLAVPFLLSTILSYMRLSEDIHPEVPNQPPASNTPAPEPAETIAAQGMSAVLKNKNFLTLWGGQIFSQLADKVYLVLMIAIIEGQFQAENQTISGWVSAIMIASTIPAILFGSFAGVYVDRWNKKRVLVSTNILRGLLVLAVPVLLWLSHGAVVAKLPLGFELLLVVTFASSTLTQFFAPAEQATISTIVEKQDLLSANSLYTTTMMGSLVVGFAVGEPVLGLADAVAARFGLGSNIGQELVVGSSYIIAGLLLQLLKINEQPQKKGEEAHVLADIKEGVRYLGQNRSIRVAMIQLVTLFSVFASMTILVVRLAEILPEIKASQFGFLLATGGIGMGIGALLLGYLSKILTHDRLAMFGSIGVAASLAAMSLFTHSLWLTVLMIVSMGIFGAFIAIPMQTRIQSETPPEMRGKVFGLQNNGVNIALSLPLALTGVAETMFGVPNVLLGLSLVVVILTAYLYIPRSTAAQQS